MPCSRKKIVASILFRGVGVGGGWLYAGTIIVPAICSEEANFILS